MIGYRKIGKKIKRIVSIRFLVLFLPAIRFFCKDLTIGAQDLCSIVKGKDVALVGVKTGLIIYLLTE